MVAVIPNTWLYNKSALSLRKYLIDNRFIKEIIDFNSEKIFKEVSVYCCITVFTKDKKEQLCYNKTFINYNNVQNYSLFNKISSSKTLKDICKISNGIATLRDKIYIHETPLFDEGCWKEITNGPKTRYIIYPYENGNIILDNEFKNLYPLTYQFLIEKKNELAKRDKGNKQDRKSTRLNSSHT